MTITVTDARHARGYSGYDHLIDDSPLDAIVGKTFRSLAAAGKAALAATRGTQDRRLIGGGPYLIEDQDGRCHRVWGDGTPV